jgi:hypothetical protein
MRAFDRRQLIIEFRRRFAARSRGRNRDNSPARAVFAEPTYVKLVAHHALRRQELDVAQWGRRRLV